MVTTHDKFTNVGLFQSMTELGELKFISEFLTAKQLDTLYIAKFGTRLLGCQFEDMPVQAIAQIVYDSFANTWNKQFDLLATDMPLLKTFETTRKSTTIADYNRTNTTRDVTDENYNTSTFNDGVVNTDNNSINKDTQFTESDKQNHDTQFTESGFKGNSYRLLKNAIDYLKVNLIYDIIMVDINELLTLKIF